MPNMKDVFKRRLERMPIKTDLYQGDIMNLREMKEKLETLSVAFMENGGRGVEQAEEIDQLKAEVDVLEGRDIKVDNHFPDADSIVLKVGSFTITVYMDAEGEYDRKAHVDITDNEEGSTTYLIVGTDNETPAPAAVAYA
tara:strand:+ start:2355 stop:2774 length:420 start_codon:yes stop_codon:yes gene_type:complete